MKIVAALVIRAFGLVALVIAAILLWDWFAAEIWPYLVGSRPHNSIGFAAFRDAGAALAVFGITCRLVARRMLRRKVTSMKTLALPLLAALVLCGCDDFEHVSPAEFKRHYALVSQPQTMHTTSYLGQRDRRAFLRLRSMSTISQKQWSDRVIYVELAELDQEFRNALPKIPAEISR